MNTIILILRSALLAALLLAGNTWAQDDESAEGEPAQAEQDDVSKALDSTATQWSFQFAWQQTDWKTDGRWPTTAAGTG
ncbi:MAG: hypothetical protein HKP19_12385 [Xanthomonadales bacterium]|nr:hypothetical protein [Xanthomonadales bacterium]